jgi:GT2 family glycosyltransferase
MAHAQVRRVSVVVPTRNVEDTVERCLRSILAELPEEDRDVIVVDNGSVDSTRALVRRFPVRLEVIPAGFVSRSRNVGAGLARHPIVAFVDSDCMVKPGWHAAVLRAFAGADVGVAGGRYDIPHPASWPAVAWERAHRIELGDSPVEVKYLPGGNIQIRRDLFHRLGGFDEALETGEEPDLCRRAAAEGHRVLESPGIRCIHLGEPMALGAVFKRERWHGRGVRLRYGDGRLAPIMISTMGFAAMILLMGAGVLSWLATSRTWFLAAIPVPLVVPLTYAGRYARDGHHFVQLTSVYLAYFLGRAAALPVALGRELQRTLRTFGVSSPQRS